ncbi:MAG: putative pyridoxal phosphate-dependent enzyme apparently involved in regulation of cell wall biogen [Bacteroidetes bacterium HLUCCA01]|nr:MAG: putative pyridoxal phosphate-dependent enzyme apparently involved in regulation of cell wall biogen [Bacteroidetes bacterium HLUCCA01]
MIPVTKPFMPPLEEYQKLLQGVWEREHLTNNGPLVQELEQKLQDYLGVKNLLYLSNGTIALQIAIKALDLKGEIITTPFSYVATTSSIVWEGCTPVFVDIDLETLNLNPALIEEAITDSTTGILATHVFGNPCDIDAIQAIADKHGLKVIYDAAHCFGTKYKGKSVFSYGDVSTTSFHATKLFHTIEGGAVFTNDEDLQYRMSRMRNFGHAGPEHFDGVGINGKNSEFHAAMGLTNLNYIEDILQSRKEQCLRYDELLKGLIVRSIAVQEASCWNYSYYPIILESEEVALRVKKALEKNDIFPRRYFYPSLDTLGYVETEALKVSKDISRRILCLPLYVDLVKAQQQKIVEIIETNLIK